MCARIFSYMSELSGNEVVDAPLMSNDKKKEKRDFPELRKQRNFEENNAMKATETPVSLSNMQIEAEEEICKDALK